MRVTSLAYCLVLLRASLAPCPASADCIDYGDYLHWVADFGTPGYARGIAITGTFAVVAGYDSGVHLIDLSNPESPQLLGSLDTPDYAVGVAVSGTYAYIADTRSGLQVIDISNPQNPSIAGTVDTPGEARGVAVSGSYAYVADYGEGVQVIDVSNPHDPEIVGTVATPGQSSGVAVSGTYAYIADGSRGFAVIDVADPRDPRFLTSLYMGTANGVTVAGSQAYVATEGGLTIVDVLDPQNPQILGGVYTLRGAQCVTISGMHAYVVSSYALSGGLHVIDIANPHSPRIVGNVPTGGMAIGVAISGMHAYATVNGPLSGGLEVIDIANPQSSPIVGTQGIPPYGAHGLDVSGSYAYLTCSWAGLYVVDISNPSSPLTAGTVNFQGTASHVAVSGSHAYVTAASGSPCLKVIDATSPSSPQIVGSINMPDNGLGVAVSGTYAYVADFRSGLQVIDVSNPQDPWIVGSVDTPDRAVAVAVSGERAYVADAGSLQIVDVADPRAPRIVGQVETPGSMWSDGAVDVAIQGTLAYVSGAAGLRVIDIGEDEHPRIVGTVATRGAGWSVAVSGRCAYVSDDGAGLQVIDISNPASPRLVGTAYPPSQSNDAIVSDGFVVVADGSGLVIVPTHCQLSVVSVTPRFARPTGPVNALVLGSGFQGGSDVLLVGADTPDIPGLDTTVLSADSLATVFDLTDQPLGVRDLVVRNPDLHADTLHGAFAITEGGVVDLLNQVEDNYASLHTLRCNVTQSIWQGQDSLLHDARAQLMVKEPDKLRLETVAQAGRACPAGIIIVNGTREYLVDAETGGVVEHNLLEETQLTEEQWLGFDFVRGLPAFMTRHDLRITGTYEESGTTVSVIEAVPRTPNPSYQTAELHVREDHGTLLKLVLRRPGGSEVLSTSLCEEQILPGTWLSTRMRLVVSTEEGAIEGEVTFTDVEGNPVLADSLFETPTPRAPLDWDVGYERFQQASELASVQAEQSCDTTLRVLPDWAEPGAYKPNPILLIHGFAGGSLMEWDPGRDCLRPHVKPYAGGEVCYLYAPDLSPDPRVRHG